MSRAALLACAAAAVAIATIGWEVQDGGVPEPVPVAHLPAPARAVREARGGSQAQEVVSGWVATTLERPLFRENRRPLALAADPARAGDEPLRLTGVITGPFGDRAIFLSSDSPKPIIAEKGARVSGFVVRAIEPGLAVLEGAAGSVRTLKPSFAPGDRPAHNTQ
jgi:hypothetical protein